MSRLKKLVPLEYSLDVFFVRILSILCLSVLARCMTHFVSITPYIDFWQDEYLWKYAVETLSYSWTWYVQSSYIEHLFTQANYVIGILLSTLLTLMILVPWHLKSLLHQRKPLTVSTSTQVNQTEQPASESSTHLEKQQHIQM